MALTLASDFIKHALRRCGQMRPGYTPQTELLTDGLNEWGLMFDAYAAERTMGFSIPDYQYNVTGPGSQSNGNGYLIGPTAHAAGNANDFQGPRPASIVRANCVMLNQGPSPVYLPMRPISAEEWADLAIRQIPAINVTNLFYYDPQFPNGVLNIFPPQTGNAIELFCWQALATPATLGTTYSAPPAYADMVIKNLSKRMWPLCTKDMMPNKLPYEVICGQAYAAEQVVRTLNRPVPTLRNNFPSRHQDGFYDSFVSYTGEPY